MQITAGQDSSIRRAGNIQGWLLVATMWLASAGAVLIAPVLPFMEKSFSDIPNAKLLLLIALVVPGLMIALLSPFIGMVVDYFGRKRFFMFAVVLYAICGALPFWLTDIHHILASRVFVGIAEAGINTIAGALIADYFSGLERQKWMTLVHGSASLFSVTMFALGGFLGGSAAGWHAPFLVYGLALVFFPLIGLFIWEPTHVASTTASAAPVSDTPFRWSRIADLCALTLVSAIMFFVVPVQISFLLNARGVATPETIGLCSAIANMGIPAGAFVFHRLASRPIHQLLAISFGLFATGFASIFHFRSVEATVIGAFIACAAGGMAMPLLQTWIMARLPVSQSGRGSGGFMGSFFMGNFISPILIAMLGGALGGLVPVVGAFALFCAVVTVIALLAPIVARTGHPSVQDVRTHTDPATQLDANRLGLSTITTQATPGDFT